MPAIKPRTRRIGPIPAAMANVMMQMNTITLTRRTAMSGKAAQDTLAQNQPSTSQTGHERMTSGSTILRRRTISNRAIPVIPSTARRSVELPSPEVMALASVIGITPMNM